MNFLWCILPLVFGFVLDAVLGDPYQLPHPIRWIGTMIAKLEKRLRKHFPERETFAGALLAVLVLCISTLLPALLLLAGYWIHLWVGILIESILCYYLLAAKCLKTESMKVYAALQENKISDARSAVSMIVGRDTAQLSAEGITKAAVETVAENTSDGVTAPMFYIALGGAAAGFFYKAANTMDSMIGYQNKTYLHFGRFAAKLDDLLNFIPSRFTALLMVVSAWILRMDAKNAWNIWRRDRLKHASPNSAQTEAACAGALQVMLAGDAYYFGELHPKQTIGDPIRPICNADIPRANALMYVTACLMLVVSIGLRGVLWGVLL